MANAPRIISNNRYSPDTYDYYDRSPAKHEGRSTVDDASIDHADPQPRPMARDPNDQIRPTSAAGRRAHDPIFGLQYHVFWLLLAITCMMIGIIIGGGVGGALAVQKAKQRANAAACDAAASNTVTETILSMLPTPTPPACATPTILPNPYIAAPLNDVRSISVRCPSSILNFNLAAPDIRKGNYKYSCQDDINLADDDLTSFTAYTLQQCVDACSQYNAQWKKNYCKGVVLASNVENRRGVGNGANCWLKESASESVEGKGFTLVRLME